MWHAGSPPRSPLGVSDRARTVRGNTPAPGRCETKERGMAEQGLTNLQAIMKAGVTLAQKAESAAALNDATTAATYAGAAKDIAEAVAWLQFPNNTH